MTITLFPDTNPIHVYFPNPKATLKGDMMPAVLQAMRDAPSIVAMKKNLPESVRSKKMRITAVRVITRAPMFQAQPQLQAIFHCREILQHDE
ncbi:hypothetical protein FHEFKHOI_00675 [Candidatus Methanoperedenaceae archaeon GB50]|nr:hypothetical protein FHEFKHOI_00675 [Candidatus Methanoperedenaceae archaeon GB50]CAD7775520.1 MAG: hypothetical protein KBONHNOK_00822 [Candidatus Methanoperedenaceae archaeon GB50]